MNKNRFIAAAVALIILFAISASPLSAEAVDDDLTISAEHGIIVNMDTDTVLYTKAADDIVFCGFLPRLMTCILLVESKIDLNTVITVNSQTDALTPQLSSANINSGDKVSLGDLMNAVLVCNSQEAAVAIALYLSDGQIYSFLDSMDARAAAIGAENTHFGNVTGFYSRSSLTYTTARDAMKIVCHALTLDYILERSNQRYVSLEINGRSRKIYTRNGLIDYGSSYYYNNSNVSGLALHGDAAIGSSMASMVTDKSIRFVSVAISSYSIVNTYEDIKNMLVFSLNEYEYKTLLMKNYPVKEVTVKLGKDRDYVVLATDGEISISLPRSADMATLQNITDAPQELRAPIKKGDILGSVTVIYDGETVGRVNLVAQNDVELDLVALYTSYITDFFSNKYFWATAITLLLIIVFYIVLTHMINNRKKRRAQSESRDRIKFR